MTLSDPQPGFQGHGILTSRISQKTVHFRDKVTIEPLHCFFLLTKTKTTGKMKIKRYETKRIISKGNYTFYGSFFGLIVAYMKCSCLFYRVLLLFLFMACQWNCPLPAIFKYLSMQLSASQIALRWEF